MTSIQVSGFPMYYVLTENKTGDHKWHKAQDEQCQAPGIVESNSNGSNKCYYCLNDKSKSNTNSLWNVMHSHVHSDDFSKTEKINIFHA